VSKFDATFECGSKLGSLGGGAGHEILLCLQLGVVRASYPKQREGRIRLSAHLLVRMVHIERI
jgi:hypothetical protein